MNELLCDLAPILAVACGVLFLLLLITWIGIFSKVGLKVSFFLRENKKAEAAEEEEVVVDAAAADGEGVVCDSAIEEVPLSASSDVSLVDKVKSNLWTGIAIGVGFAALVVATIAVVTSSGISLPF